MSPHARKSAYATTGQLARFCANGTTINVSPGSSSGIRRRLFVLRAYRLTGMYRTGHKRTTVFPSELSMSGTRVPSPPPFLLSAGEDDRLFATRRQYYRPAVTFDGLRYTGSYTNHNNKNRSVVDIKLPLTRIVVDDIYSKVNYSERGTDSRKRKAVFRYFRTRPGIVRIRRRRNVRSICSSVAETSRSRSPTRRALLITRLTTESSVSIPRSIRVPPSV